MKKNSIVRALFSGFALSGGASIIGLIKMGFVAHATSTELLNSYFIYLAIWALFATNGESVRQAARQMDSDFTWKSGFYLYKCEWRSLLPLSLASLAVSELASPLRENLSFQDLLVTLFFGWIFVYSSACTGYLESKGRVEIANLTTLIISITTLLPFIFLTTINNFTLTLLAYFLLNIVPGLVHLLIVSKLKNNTHDRTSNKLHSDIRSFKQIIVFESLPRMFIPFVLANFGNATDLPTYTVLTKVFIIYGIFSISITPIVALQEKQFTTALVKSILRVLGPLVFLVSSGFILLFSEELIILIGATDVDINYLQLMPFVALGGISILTQPIIFGFSDGSKLLIRRKSALISSIFGLSFALYLGGSLGASGGFLALSLQQLTYICFLRFFSKDQP